MAETTWKDIEEFPDYEVSDRGDIRLKWSGKPIHPQQGDDGHYQVYLRQSGRMLTRAVHVLEAIAFLGSHTNSKVVHKDGNKLNNELENLEWV